MIKLRIPVLFLVAVLMAGCGLVSSLTGSGNVVTQEEDITGFDWLEVSDGFHVDIRQSNTFSVVIRTDDNLMPATIDLAHAGVVDRRTVVQVVHHPVPVGVGHEWIATGRRLVDVEEAVPVVVQQRGAAIIKASDDGIRNDIDPGLVIE